MKFSQISIYFLPLFVTASLLVSCEKENIEPEAGVGTVELEMDHVVGTVPLTLNTTTYTTSQGDQFTVNTFRYYLSNIKLQKADGTEYVQPESYYLVNQGEESTYRLTPTDVPAAHKKAPQRRVGGLFGATDLVVSSRIGAAAPGISRS